MRCTCNVRAIRSVIVALMRNNVVRLRYRTVILRVCRRNESHNVWWTAILRYIRSVYIYIYIYIRSLVSLTCPARILPFRSMAVSGRATLITPSFVPSRRTAPTLRPRSRGNAEVTWKGVAGVTYFVSPMMLRPRDRRASRGNSKRELRNAKVSSEFLACLKAAYRRYRSRANVPRYNINAL